MSHSRIEVAMKLIDVARQCHKEWVAAAATPQRVMIILKNGVYCICGKLTVRTCTVYKEPASVSRCNGLKFERECVSRVCAVGSMTGDKHGSEHG